MDSTAAISKRPRRFSRRPSKDVPAIERSPRDEAIIRLVGDHRFITTNHIVPSLRRQGFSEQKTRQRLRLLYDHRLIDKLDKRRHYWRYEGSKPDIYAIDQRGAELYAELCGLPASRTRWREKNQNVGTDYIEHQLLITEVLLAFERACGARPGMHVVPQRAIKVEPGIEGNPFAWRVEVPQRPRPLPLAVVPDKVFGVGTEGRETDQHPHHGATGSPGAVAWFFLEADRGTMAILPKDPRIKSKTTLFHKFLGYCQTYIQGVHKSRFNIPNFRVLTVTSRTMDRCQSMMKAALEATDGRYANMFMFATADMIAEHDILSMPWLNAAGEERRLRP